MPLRHYAAPERTTINEHLDTWLEGKRDIRPARPSLTRRRGMQLVRQMLGHSSYRTSR
jgi:hypothetical protein